MTEGYHADRETVLRLLNEALATELVCNLRYRRHFFMAMGIHSRVRRQEFREHADQEQEHADQIAERIVQLGGEPRLQPARADRPQPRRIRARATPSRSMSGRTWWPSASPSTATAR